MGCERGFVGLDVHAWPVTGHGLDAVTGEVWQRRLSSDPSDVEGWLRSLPGPVAVTYEAGPTGFGLARHLRGVVPVRGGGSVEAVAAVG